VPTNADYAAIVIDKSLYLFARASEFSCLLSHRISLLGADEVWNSGSRNIRDMLKVGKIPEVQD
jgi:hypothetical protein